MDRVKLLTPMNILHVIGTLDPAYGGPVEGLRQRSVALHELGYRSEVVTSDPADAPWLHDFPGMVYALGPSWGKYSYNPRLIGWLQAHVRRYDVVLASGIWQYHTFAVWRAARRTGFPYFVFVHGMLDPWFNRAFPLKHAKKWLYWPWATYRVLRDARAVLFTSTVVGSSTSPATTSWPSFPPPPMPSRRPPRFSA